MTDCSLYILRCRKLLITNRKSEVMTTSDDDDDDFSPEDAFNMFTAIYGPRSRDRFPVVVPPRVHEEEDQDVVGLSVTLDTSLLTGVTLAGAGGADGRGPPPDILDLPRDEVSVGWIFDETTDTVLVPLLLSVIGLFAVVSNLVVLSTFVGMRRMRSGPNLLLSNLAVADLAIIAAAVPTAVVSRLLGVLAVSPQACRFVHYVIFVGVYVSMYTLVVVCVFGFFGELLRGAGSRGKYSDARRGTDLADGGTSMPLTVCSAVVSSVVIWAAFAASHLSFVLQADVVGLAAFEEPLICVYGASGVSEDGESTRARTLWITFLACAFLLPLTIVCALSGVVLRFQRRRHRHDVGRGEVTSTGCGREVETSQNLDNDGRAQRELTVIVMASTVVRTICWLPLQIFVLTDVFGPEPETQTPGTKMPTEAEMEMSDAETAYRRKWELFCVCVALTGSCLSLPLLHILSTECRHSFRLVLRRRCHGSGETENHHNLTAARRLQMEPGPPCSPSLTAAMLHRQHSYQPGNEFDVGRPRHLSLPPGGRLSVPDVNETILSIISDSSNHINYA